MNFKEINWEEVKKEAASYLSDLIRINTTNPPGNETPAAQYLAKILEKEGLKAEILEEDKGRGNLIARLEGEDKDSLLLLSHLDVVPAEKERWSVNPFSGEIKSNYIWGRGAIDCKSLVINELMTLLLLRRNKAKLKRKLIVAFCADEEKGGEKGIEWLVKTHYDKIKADYVINEGGGLEIIINNKPFYICQTAEKGICWLRLKAKGTPGHASMPIEDNAVIHLSKALHRISNFQPPLKGTATMRQMIKEIAGKEKFPQSLLLKLLTNPLLSPFILRRIKEKGLVQLLNALLHNTFVPTVLKGGNKTNVIPSQCEAEVDCRLLPGETVEGVVKELKKVLENTKIDIEVFESHPATESSYHTSLFLTIQEVLSLFEPSAKIIPFMLSGATDSRFLREKGIISYGFAPFKAEVPLEEYYKMVHGVNEKISLSNLTFGTKVLFEIVRRFCQSAG